MMSIHYFCFINTLRSLSILCDGSDDENHAKIYFIYNKSILNDKILIYEITSHKYYSVNIK